MTTFFKNEQGFCISVSLKKYAIEKVKKTFATDLDEPRASQSLL